MIVKIEKVVFGGKGLARLDDKVCFVPFVLPDEEVEVEVVKEKKSLCEGVPKKLLKTSEYRREAPCPYYTLCGGCDFQHITYEKQVQLKEEILKETFSRLAKENVELTKTVPSPQEFYYRNRVQFKHDGKNFGFFKPDSNDVIDIDECLIADERINQLIPVLKRFVDPSVKEVHVFVSPDGKALVKFIIDRNFELDFDTFVEERPVSIAGVGIYRGNRRLKIFGKNFVFYKVGKFNFRVSIDSFFQVNRFQVENFINEVVEEVPSDKNLTVGDLFCGVGTLSIPVAKKVKKVFGVEISKSAIKDANYNARINNVNNVSFYEVSADRAIDVIYGHNPDILIVDPPRTGLAKKLIEKINQLSKLKKIIYVSCNPTTLARDYNLLKEGGFKLTKLKMIDMFPQTHHIESIAVLDRS